MKENSRIVGIVTIDDYTNYGNRLQNYALTKLLEKENIRVLNGIRVYTKEDWVSRTRSTPKRWIKRLMPFFIVKNKLYKKPVAKNKLIAGRKENFIKFISSYSTIIDPVIVSNHKKAINALNKHGIGSFIAGSDQVWNPYYEAKEYEFLTFIPKEKRLSFAASMGADSIPEDSKWFFKRNLSDMKYISVREERTAEIVKELTGRTADITLDPTLLLDKADWELVVKKPAIHIEDKYICTYFLGEVPEAVERFAYEKGLAVYALNSQDSPELFILDPGEFLYMIQNAAYVLTDSFHAVAFSIKFHREFYVFDRKQTGVESMFSRIETITNRFNLENRIQNRDRIEEQEPISHWAEIDRILLAEKTRSMKRLLAAMEA